MNTIEILILILLGFLILNQSLDSIQEGFSIREGLENSESKINNLIKTIKALNVKNTNRFNKVEKELAKTMKDFDSLQKSLKSSNTTAGKMKTIAGHSSVQAAPPAAPPQIIPPSGTCPWKHGKIAWPLIKEGFTNPSSLETEHNLQVSKVWSPAYASMEADLMSNAHKFNNIIILIEMIENTGNVIQKTLQNNNF